MQDRWRSASQQRDCQDCSAVLSQSGLPLGLPRTVQQLPALCEDGGDWRRAADDGADGSGAGGVRSGDGAVGVPQSGLFKPSIVERAEWGVDWTHRRGEGHYGAMV